MLHTFKTLFTYQHISFPRSLPSNLSRKTSKVRFCTNPDTDRSHKMDKNNTQNPNKEASHGDVISHSFGEGYATRSDEEGFGGIYGGNQSLPDKPIHENHPDYDKTQGSEVKEKEKARHQTNANA
ncbi:hypothetical protein Lal_00025654 [Lupinus albus]|uniref:Uncharacterized protein n=1 Tax=Lupinus albus TaxID=3870 RepID=A0A6A5LJH3_LUPAL|nr:hypothetical protein Lalb_Chr09g0322441 [Lupinus albus]KAF1861367.1 hypothetical protein Lal_00025654 [Lupinus albus]